MKALVDVTVENLKKNGFMVECFENISDAKKYLLNEIDKKKNIGIGGSMTIFNSNIHKDLMERGNSIYWHWLEKAENKNEALKKAKNASVYLSSSNAITSEGKIINIDGVGNRVTSMVYGHDKIYIVVGINKIVETYEKAINRIKTISCPQNAERLNLNTPCRHTGECSDCKSDDRMCNITMVLEKKPMKSDIEVLIVNEELGY